MRAFDVERLDYSMVATNLFACALCRRHNKKRGEDVYSSAPVLSALPVFSRPMSALPVVVRAPCFLRESLAEKSVKIARAPVHSHVVINQHCLAPE
jgi:hypothetical protein